MSASPIVGDQDLAKTHFTKHLHHRLHWRLVRNLEGGGVHETPKVHGGHRALLQLLVDPASGVNKEDTRLSCGTVPPAVHLVCRREGSAPSSTLYIHDMCVVVLRPCLGSGN